MRDDRRRVAPTATTENTAAEAITTTTTTATATATGTRTVNGLGHGAGPRRHSTAAAEAGAIETGAEPIGSIVARTRLSLLLGTVPTSSHRMTDDRERIPRPSGLPETEPLLMRPGALLNLTRLLQRLEAALRAKRQLASRMGTSPRL